ncbi:MAG: methylmalonyl-CoA mutase family protein [Bacteroidetes bacterium]|nr:methylmalonyl-CoA mutase family protein [Bacteroidota bacterium]
MSTQTPLRTRHKIRFVTAASLFDGHDASINIMRRILQASGAEVIHLGHNRSVSEIVETAIMEDVQGIAISSYQGGHLEYFKYMISLLQERGAGHIRVFGGGGGVIVPGEIRELMDAGVTRIYSPEDGREMGLQGMINDMLEKTDFSTLESPGITGLPTSTDEIISLARTITLLESGIDQPDGDAYHKVSDILHAFQPPVTIPVVGITGTGGAGKSSLTDELIRRFCMRFPSMRIAILSVDPSKRKTGGALLGDRIRMNAIYNGRVFMRSLATRAANQATSKALKESIQLCKLAGFNLVIVETAGIGQSDSSITDLVDVSVYVMTPEYGAASQLEKIDMLDLADLIVLNKFEKRGAEDALRDIRKTVQRNHNRWSESPDDMPVFPTIASQFNDTGTNWLFDNLLLTLNRKTGTQFEVPGSPDQRDPRKQIIIPPDRTRYLAEIADSVSSYKAYAGVQSEAASLAGACHQVLKHLGSQVPLPGDLYDKDDLFSDDPAIETLRQRYQEAILELTSDSRDLIRTWEQTLHDYRDDIHHYEVRGQRIEVDNFTRSLSHVKIPKVSLPSWSDWGDLLRWQLLENVPGKFPFTAGVFEYKRKSEDPTRMFAGEGTPERTNRRFHYVSKGQPAARLSTAFDSVTLYGEDPARRPDIFGKIGNSGVSVCTVDDAKKLYSGFDLCAPTTSVSMTINGPAPMMLAFFLNAAIDQQVEKYIHQSGTLRDTQKLIADRYCEAGLPVPVYEGGLPEGNQGLGLALLGLSGDAVIPPQLYEKIRRDTLASVRGTVQADILKEDQAQNTCIFSTEFALRMMGDIQDYFIRNQVRNYYSVSISGYHIAEAGANPISQLAFTLANGFTYVEYYLSRGMKIDDFAPNLSFFFSNGIDPEYAVIGRVARRIWATAMKRRYGANERSQKLKYHIQTSGRSLHAQEIDFNDIRTTLQALYAIYDNCNSLHTNAYDEAITTPTEESVRRAMAIQLIINRELGLAKNENPLQGAFIIDELTNLVEEAVLAEFRRISDRGGVLGAMETMYQRGKIQEESMYYEHLKHSGELPIVGVNTFLNPQPPVYESLELIRSTDAEKQQQIGNLEAFHQRNRHLAGPALERLKTVAVSGGNLFAELMETVKVCSLGQISQALYEVGGQYRRNM